MVILSYQLCGVNHTFFRVPVRTFYDGLGQGTVGVALSHDSRYLATLGIKTPQVLSIWDWTEERETPLHSISISVDHGMQVSPHTYVCTV